MPNRLALEKSPYLRQHAHNPVDWFPWGDEALALARETDRPIFLSVGYAACHWCHVMERESFEDAAVAEVLNAHFVPIKVDREERPDLDEIYMTAVQLMTGSGGWPMSVFLTPGGRPFYGGTYFPPESAHGRVGFRSLLLQLSQAWRERRDEVEQVAGELVVEIEKAARQRPEPGAPTGAEALLESALDHLTRRFDGEHGGFGNPPKFPPHHALRLLCEADRRGLASADAVRMRDETLEKMALGGIYDHIGGGFHRYSTDRIWLVPHFEKMLYDNALLARVYAEALTLTGRAAFGRVARETCEMLLRDFLHPDGGFFGAIDADSEGEEGKYYVWSRAEAEALAGASFCDDYQIRARGNWHDEATRQPLTTSIPHRVGELPGELSPETLAARDALLQARKRRVPPLRDEKILTAWNGLAIGALAVAGKALGEPRFTAAAKRAADFCLTTLRISHPPAPSLGTTLVPQAKEGESRLLHRWADGEAAIEAFLDDYAYLADGLLDLCEATGESRWKEEAQTLAEEMLVGFWDDEDGGFFFTSGVHEALLARSKDLFDGALPSPNGVASRVLARLGGELAERADDLLRAYGGVLSRVPHGTLTLLEVGLLLSPSLQPESRITQVSSGASPWEETFFLTVPSGWHVENLSATASSELELGAVRLPGNLEGDTLALVVPVALSSKLAPGARALTITVRFSPCNTRECLPARELTARKTVRVV